MQEGDVSSLWLKWFDSTSVQQLNVPSFLFSPILIQPVFYSESQISEIGDRSDEDVGLSVKATQKWVDIWLLPSISIIKSFWSLNELLLILQEMWLASWLETKKVAAKKFKFCKFYLLNLVVLVILSFFCLSYKKLVLYIVKHCR